MLVVYFFFFNDTPTTEIYTLSLHDALPISHLALFQKYRWGTSSRAGPPWSTGKGRPSKSHTTQALDRKSTRLNSSHTVISYAVFCLKKKKKKKIIKTSNSQYEQDMRLAALK